MASITTFPPVSGVDTGTAYDDTAIVSRVEGLENALDELQTQNDEFVRSQDVKKIVTMTQLDYEYLSYVDPEVLYIIVPQT